uniref:Complex 1 LYR protein domain-containing protein n=1 Tax=Peronospora matthiolae TaxID=2874970 RepID=A0AAV1VN84_9STRA
MGVTRRALGPEIKSLQFFLNRTAVLKLYREFLRISKPLATEVQLDVRRQIRAGFDACRDEEDEQHVSLLLRQARDQMKMVSDSVDTAMAQQRDERIREGGDAVAAKQKGGAAETVTSDMWVELSSEKGDGTEDVKGRVGSGWPWKSGKVTEKLDLVGIKRR